MANQFFKLDGLVEMVTRRVSEDFNGFLANASGYQNTQFQKLIGPASKLSTVALTLDFLSHNSGNKM